MMKRNQRHGVQGFGAKSGASVAFNSLLEPDHIEVCLIKFMGPISGFLLQSTGCKLLGSNLDVHVEVFDKLNQECFVKNNFLTLKARFFGKKVETSKI